MRWTVVMTATVVVVATGCASTGGSGDGGAGFATSPAVVSTASSFDVAAAGTALNRAYPSAGSDALATALEIARAACDIEGYEATAEGTAAIFALRQTAGSTTVISTALAAGCSNPTNASGFLTAIGRKPGA